MKKAFIIMCAGLILASCAKVSDTTVINGSFSSEDAPEAVYIVLDEMGISDMVEVTDGKFTYEVPTDRTTAGAISTGFSQIEFIPDGTVLNVDFTGENPVVTSDDAKNSVQERYNEFVRSIDEVLSQGSFTSEEEYQEAAYDLCLNTIKKNYDNAAGLIALASIYDISSYSQRAELLSYIDKGPLKDKEIIKEMMESLVTGEATSEGKMFTDFTVVQDPSDPEGSTVKFSDYIGKGKYVLVDFWASWCGPCKQEMPFVIDAYNKYAGDKFGVLSIAVWDEPEASKDAVDDFGIVWDTIINAQQIPTDIYGIDGIPHIILFGPDGTILKRGLRGGMIEAELSKYLK